MSDPNLTGRCILLVEDEYMVAEPLAELLEVWGATILGPAPTLEQALGLLARTDQIDFALVDVNLRGIKAFPLADALLARGVPFVFTTGYGTSMIPEPYRDVAVVQKPFSKIALAKALLVLAS